MEPGRYAWGGFTILEALVVLGVIGLLVALTLPAVLAARGAARATACRNNLKQIGLALHEHAAVRGRFPGGCEGGWSAQAHLLPWVGAEPLAERIDLKVPSYETDWPQALGVESRDDMPSPQAWFCPDDGAGGGETGTNYFYNSGVSRAWGSVWDGPFQGVGVAGGTALAPDQIKDGLTQTAAFSEARLGGTGAERVLKHTRYRYRTDDRATEFFLAECNAPGWPLDGQEGRRGQVWVACIRGQSGYTHSGAPNSQACLNAGDWGTGSWPADSSHAGGVNVLFADGSARLIADSVGRQTWRALGTHSGGERFPEYF